MLAQDRVILGYPKEMGAIIRKNGTLSYSTRTLKKLFPDDITYSFEFINATRLEC